MESTNQQRAHIISTDEDGHYHNAFMTTGPLVHLGTSMGGYLLLTFMEKPAQVTTGATSIIIKNMEE